MAGYCEDYSMSRNARNAYGRGLVPASKVDRRIPVALVTRYCRAAEWHHASKHYNRVDFYDPGAVLAIFGIESSADYEPDPLAIAALHEWRKSKREYLSTILEDATVEWLEWSGSLRRPRAIERKAEGRRITIKGQTATIELPDGGRLVKRIHTNGFRFTV